MHKHTAKSVRTGVAPTQERHNHNGGVTFENIPVDDGPVLIRRYRAVWECPLDAYKDLGLIDEAAHRAGLQFHEAYYGTILNGRLDLRPVSEEQAAKCPNERERHFKEARKALPADELKAVIDVCGHNMHIWKPSALEKLHRGLGRLALEWHTNAIEVCEHKRKD